MNNRLFRALLIGSAFFVPVAQAHAQVATTAHAACVGGAIGCTQMDFFIDFVGLTDATNIDMFTLALQSVNYRFAAPGTTEAEDALGLNFYTPTVSADGRALTGIFDLGAVVDPTFTSLRVRAELDQLPAETVDATQLAFAYTVGAGGETLSAGQYAPANVTATPEPATLALVGTGFFAMTGWARRRRNAVSRYDVLPENGAMAGGARLNCFHSFFAPYTSAANRSGRSSTRAWERSDI